MINHCDKVYFTTDVCALSAERTLSLCPVCNVFRNLTWKTTFLQQPENLKTTKNMECNRPVDHIRKISRYSVSFQDQVTEVTPLLGHASRKIGGSLRDLSHCESDSEISECEVPIAGQTSTALIRQLNTSVNDEPSGSRSFSEGAAILKYSSHGGDATIPIRFCSHGNNYESCCGKDSNRANGHNSEVQIEGGDQGHCHSNEQRAIDKKARRRLLFASALCLVFMMGEVIGGYLADSLAIMTDAAHLLTDFASFMISLFAIWVSSRPPTKRMSFGWYRAEVIGALTSVLMIWVVTGILVFLAIERIRYKEYEIDALIMLITSGVGVGVNIIMGFTLHSHGHSHGGGMSHSHGQDDHQDGHEHAGTNINVRAAFIHVIGDFIQSVGVFSAALVIYFKPEWSIVDPICTFLFSVLVLLTTFAIMKDTINVLMEGLPKGVDFNEVQKTFAAIQGVVQVHNLRIWSLSMDKVALSAHLVINPSTNPRDILRTASRIVRDKYGFFEMTLQIEDMKEDMANCKECQGPKV